MPRRAVDTQAPAARGRALVRAEMERRGAIVRETREGGVVYLEAVTPGGAPLLRVRTKTRTSGSWQASVTDGQEEPAPPPVPTYWAFVDLSVSPVRTYIVEDDAVRRDIYEAHAAYLRRYGGARRDNPASNHHSIDIDRVSRRQLTWDALEIGSPRSGS